MKRLIVLCILAVCLCPYAVAECVQWYVAPSAGAYGGTVSEYVRQDGSTVSRLDWQQYAVPQAGVQGAVSWRGVYAGVSFATAIPFRCGIMEDFDFLLEDSSVASQYSYHDLYLDKRYDIGACVGYGHAFGRLALAGGVVFAYRNQKWSARDGYLQYPASGAWTGNENKTAIKGNIISYEQSVWIPSVRMEASFALSSAWSVSVRGSVSPYAFAESLDSHFLRSKQFYDTMEGGYAFCVGGGARYKRIAFFVEYEYMRIMDGDTASGTIGVSDTGVTNDAGYGSGIKSKTWTAKILFVL